MVSVNRPCGTGGMMIAIVPLVVIVPPLKPAPATIDVIPLPVRIEIVADDSILGEVHVLIENRALDLAAPGNVATIEDNGVLHF